MSLGLSNGISIGSISSTASYYATLWTPEEISPAIWYDAADASTIVESNGSVAQWDNKGTDVDADLIQPTGTAQPETGSRTLNGLNVLDCPNKYMYNTTHSTAVSVSNMYMAIVCDMDSASPGGTSDTLFKITNCSRWAHTGVSTDWTTQTAPDGTASYATLSDSSYNGPRLITLAFKVGDTNTRILVDGNEITSGFASTITAQTAISLAANNASGVGRIDGAIAEVIVVYNTVDVALLEQLDGYLAWRWGRVSNLPALHPYKNSPPFK